MLHVRVGEAAGRHIVGVHGHRFLFSCQVLIFIQRKRIDGAFIIQTTELKTKTNVNILQKCTTNNTFYFDSYGFHYYL